MVIQPPSRFVQDSHAFQRVGAIPANPQTMVARGRAGRNRNGIFVSDAFVWQPECCREGAPHWLVILTGPIEAIGGKRQYTRESTSSKLVSQFLSEMDGFSQDNHGVLILAATNVPWAVDPAFRRPGRFDRVLFVPPPDRAARGEIIQQLLNDRPVAGKIDIDFLTKYTGGFSGADLQELVETAVDDAIEETIDAGTEIPIKQTHLRQALQEVKPTTTEWLTTARNYAKYSNEAGQYNEVLEFLRKHGKS